MKKRVVAVLVVGVCLLVVPAGSAQSPNETQYGNKSAGVSNETIVAPKTPVGGNPVLVQNGSLPFTGTDLAIVVLAGAGAVAGGFGLRRLSRDGGEH